MFLSNGSLTALIIHAKLYINNARFSRFIKTEKKNYYFGSIPARSKTKSIIKYECTFASLMLYKSIVL